MAKTNQNITMHGNKLKVTGTEIKEGATLPSFTLTGNDMTDVAASKFAGKVLIVLSVPSLDTPVCALEAKRFNKEATDLSSDVTILCVSRDLPFAQKRWCAAEGATRVVTASDFKYRTFGQQFGTELPDLGLLARAVFVADKSGKITFVDYVTEVAEEPKYDEVLAAVRKLL